MRSCAQRAEFLPFSQPDIEQAEIDEVVDALRSGWITTGPKPRQFEADFAAYVEAKHAIAVNSCTATRHLLTYRNALPLLREVPEKEMRMVIKRLFDFTAALIGLILLSPISVLVGLAIRLDSPGPIFYKASRIGKDGRRFTMYKFRTMIVNADKRGPLVTAGDDSRITRVGRILRLTKLDELPTLWNVLIGEMSLVGPRPENPISAALYNEDQRRVWLVRPGITSLATIKYRHEEALLADAENLEARYFELMQDKLRFELEYIKRQSFMLDISILWRTMLAIFKI